jgi:N-acetyltransferase
VIVKPVVLQGERVRLEPLALGHLDALAAFALNPDLWRWRPHHVENKDDLERYIQYCLDAQTAGTAIPFVTVVRAVDLVVGSTGFMNIDRQNRRVEIGGTFIDPAWQRTFVNTETKYLLLRHAFECWRCIRVELKTDSENERSRRAILRLGGKEEGTLRNHMVMPNGRFRHTVYFSILDFEWPSVKQALQAKLPGSKRPLATTSVIS